MKLDKIYIIHFDPLKERKQYLEKYLSNFGIPFEFVINTKEKDEKFYNKYYPLYNGDRVLPKSEFGVTISHIETYKEIFNFGYNKCLILEDDAIFCNNFKEILNEIIEESDEYDFSFLSSCCDLNVKKTTYKYLYEASKSRSVCAYIINSKNLKLILENITPITDVIDWHLNNIKDKSNIKFSWCQPPVITQGSETIYKSNLR